MSFVPRWSIHKSTYLTLPAVGAAVAKPLLNIRLRLVAANAEREAVLNSLGRTMITDYF